MPIHFQRRRIILIPLAAIAAAGLLAFWFCLPSPLFNVTYSTAVYDRRGELLGARVSAKSGEWRFPPSAELPDKYAACLTAYEDRFFYRHPGVNPFSAVRALRQNIAAGHVVSGASTITMQTVRMARGRRRTLFQKCVEVIMATRLELTASKAEILSLYASHAPFGSNVTGIEAAAWRYFGHTSADLSWAEAALLAVLPNAPSAMNVGRNRLALLQKRNRLLAKLRRVGKMDDVAYELAVDEPLPDAPFPLPALAPHVVGNLQTERPGRRLVTTIDAALQAKVEGALDRRHREFSQNRIMHIAAVVLDVGLGEVSAYCGNVGFGSGMPGSHVDIVRAPRSSGSILKPFLYLSMLREGEILPETLIPDIPIMADRFQPQNYNLEYDGAVPASLALSRSLNLPAVNMLKQYGVEKFLLDLRAAGFGTFRYPADHYGLTLILGGGEVSLWETSVAYLRMAQSVAFYGGRNDSSSINDRRHDAGTFDWGRLPPFTGEEASRFDAGASWQTLDALVHVNRPEEIDWKSVPSMRKVAWKTGTSYGFRDAWAVGVTPEYVVGVWTGNADGAGRAGLTGVGTSAQVMFDIFNLLGHTSWFEKPHAAFEAAEVCKTSGHLAGRHCGETEAAEIIPAGFKTAACPYHTVAHLSEDVRYRVYADCHPAEKMVGKPWFVLPPVQEWFYKKRNPGYRTLPPLSPDCAANQTAQKPMAFIYPNTDNPLRLSKQMDGSTGAIALELAHRHPDAIVYWHLNDNYIGATQYFHQMSVTPKAGRHLITVVDERGNSLARRIEVNAPR